MGFSCFYRKMQTKSVVAQVALEMMAMSAKVQHTFANLKCFKCCLNYSVWIEKSNNFTREICSDAYRIFHACCTQKNKYFVSLRPYECSDSEFPREKLSFRPIFFLSFLWLFLFTACCAHFSFLLVSLSAISITHFLSVRLRSSFCLVQSLFLSYFLY